MGYLDDNMQPSWVRVMKRFSTQKMELSEEEYEVIMDEFHDFNSAAVFEALLPYLDDDVQAQDIFLMLLRPGATMFRLKKYAPEMKRGAEAGNKWLQYAWAKYNDAVNPEENSTALALEYYEKASAAGISDATMMLAYCWHDGDYGLVDKIKYFNLRDEAAQKCSLKAVWQQMRDLLWGTVGVEKDPQKVYDTLSEFIKSSEADDYPVDPIFYHLMGDAAGQVGRPSEELSDWYRQAIYLGDYTAYFWWALEEAGFNPDDGIIEDTDRFRECMAEARACGVAEGYMTELYLTSDEDFKKMTPEAQERFHSALEADLKTALELGKSDAAYQLGLSYYYAYYGFEESDIQAWKWFVTGAILHNASCFAMLSEMCEKGYAPEKFCNDEYTYYYALLSSRLGNSDMDNKVVDGYRHGHLTEFAAEIEQYYDTDLDD